MKKKSAVKLFFMSLLKSLAAMVVIIGVGYASYRISYSVLSKNGVSVGPSTSNIDDIIEEAQKDEISKNLIYVCNNKTGRITDIMVEICNTKTNNMDYVTIPVLTDYTIPTTMYRKLCQINEEIPQIVRLAKLRQYFKDEQDAYGYGELIIEKMLGIKISYYTVLGRNTYLRHYEKVNTKVSFKQNIPDATPDPATGKTTTSQKKTVKMDISVCSPSYIRQIKDLGNDREKIAEFIKDQYEVIQSNLTVYNKIGYVECYEQLSVDLFHYWGVPGTYDENKVFHVDTKAAKSMFENLTENMESYTTAQDIGSSIPAVSGNGGADKNSSDKSEANSKKKKIIVLNGSRIAGMAAAKQQILKTDGYRVPEIGDYTQEVLTRTRIIVKKKGQGKDLVKYFNDPELVVGTVQDGYDIEVILGTADANS